jgi:hypothetical protein
MKLRLKPTGSEIINPSVKTDGRILIVTGSNYPV